MYVRVEQYEPLIDPCVREELDSQGTQLSEKMSSSTCKSALGSDHMVVATSCQISIGSTKRSEQDRRRSRISQSQNLESEAYIDN